jgi:hypothetical protein
MKGATFARQPCYPLPRIALMDRRLCNRPVLRSLVRSRTSGFASHPFEWFAFIKQFLLIGKTLLSYKANYVPSSDFLNIPTTIQYYLKYNHIMFGRNFGFIFFLKQRTILITMW